MLRQPRLPRAHGKGAFSRRVAGIPLTARAAVDRPPPPEAVGACQGQDSRLGSATRISDTDPCIGSTTRIHDSDQRFGSGGRRLRPPSFETRSVTCPHACVKRPLSESDPRLGSATRVGDRIGDSDPRPGSVTRIRESGPVTCPETAAARRGPPPPPLLNGPPLPGRAPHRGPDDADGNEEHLPPPPPPPAPLPRAGQARTLARARENAHARDWRR